MCVSVCGRVWLARTVRQSGTDYLLESDTSIFFLQKNTLELGRSSSAMLSACQVIIALVEDNYVSAIREEVLLKRDDPFHSTSIDAVNDLFTVFRDVV